MQYLKSYEEKKNKSLHLEKEMTSIPSMQGKAKQKSSRPTCFNCHPQKKIFADVLKKTRENMRIEKNGSLNRMHGMNKI
jgi:DNA-directed RNA polymerase subunit M/transcription elongation factor TFIIS